MTWVSAVHSPVSLDVLLHLSKSRVWLSLEIKGIKGSLRIPLLSQLWLVHWSLRKTMLCFLCLF